MPNPQEVATVVANGMTYNYFKSIQIERRYDDVISHMRLQVAENSSGSVGGAAPELMPWLRRKVISAVSRSLAARSASGRRNTTRMRIPF